MEIDKLIKEVVKAIHFKYEFNLILEVLDEDINNNGIHPIKGIINNNVNMLF